jgi:tRNA pseudouridine38-40 synthase
MRRRLRFEVAYDGGPFAGWQSQSNLNAVQDLLERAFKAVTQEQIRVHGAGRTDAGVHALAQTAHADVPQSRLTTEQWRAALNASLPPAIRVLRCRFVTDAFHARFSAKGKVYRYRIWNSPILPPLEHGRVWHVPGALDFGAMMNEAREFIGEHDFAAFAANRGKPMENTVRTIESVRLRRTGPSIAIEFAGNGFLYKMVRLMAGALVDCGSGKASAGFIKARLEDPKRPSTSRKIVAPAAGLFLVRVRY